MILLPGRKIWTASQVIVNPPQQPLFSPWDFVLKVRIQYKPPAYKSVLSYHNRPCRVTKTPHFPDQAQEVGLQALGQLGPSENRL